MDTSAGSETADPSKMNRSLIDLPESAGARARVTLARVLRRRCPYCGGKHIFKTPFSFKERCPTCGVLFAYEDGYFLGSYVINLVFTEFLAVGIVIWMIAGTEMTVLEMQIAAVVVAVGMPLLFYSYVLLLWMVLDLVLNPPRDFSQRPRI